MPAFIAAIWGALLAILPTLVGRVLVALGIGSVTYTGLSFALDFLKAQALAALTGLGSDVVGMLSTLGVGRCISILTSAMLARLAINGMSGGSFKRWIHK